jgi:MYXO-CTERM domain-containing protein
MIMKRMWIRKDVAQGMLMVGCLGLATPALAGVTVLDAPGLFEVYSLPLNRTEDFASTPWTANGDWGSFAVSASSTGLSATASSNAINGVDTRFDWALAMVFEASTPIEVSIDYRPFAGAIGGTLLTLVELDAHGEPVNVLWSLPDQASGTFAVTIPAESGRTYALGYEESWITGASLVNPSTGGLSVTFTAVPAPGAVALLAAVGLCGTRRRR